MINVDDDKYISETRNRICFVMYVCITLLLPETMKYIYI